MRMRPFDQHPLTVPIHSLIYPETERKLLLQSLHFPAKLMSDRIIPLPLFLFFASKHDRNSYFQIRADHFVKHEAPNQAIVVNYIDF
jgi:hypothetical protein